MMCIVSSKPDRSLGAARAETLCCQQQFWRLIYDQAVTSVVFTVHITGREMLVRELTSGGGPH